MRNVLLVRSCLISTTVILAAWSAAHGDIAEYVAAVKGDSPLAYWRFEETDTSSPADNAEGDWSYDGTYMGNTLLSSGIAGNAAVFNGQDAYVQLPGTFGAGLQGRSAITIEAWIRNTNIPADNPIPVEDNVIFSALIHSGRSGAIMQMNGSHIAVGARSTESEDMQNQKADYTSTDQWHHLVGVLLFGDEEIHVYIDGERQDNPDEMNVSFLASTYGYDGPDAGPTIGAFWNGSDLNRCFSGAIDEVAIYPRALTAAEILEHFELMPEPVSESIPEPSTLMMLCASSVWLLGRKRKSRG